MQPDIKIQPQNNGSIVLFCLADPFIKETGYSLRVMQTIKSVQDDSLCTITFTDPETQGIRSSDLPERSSQNSSCLLFKLKQERFSILKMIKGYGFSANQAFFSKDNFHAVDEIIRRYHPKCIIMEGFYFFNFLKLSEMKKYPVIVDLHNYEIRRLISTLKASFSFRKNLLIILALADYIYSQIRFKRSVANYWIPSREEKEKLGKLFRIEHEKIKVIPNSVTCDDNLENQIKGNWKSKTLLFAGNYSYPPNEEAARILVKDLLPQIRKYNKNIICWLAGPNPPAWMKDLNDSGIIVPGYLQDLTHIYRESCMLVAPLLHGGGSKFKVIHALSRGLPVIGTDEAFTGIDVSDTKYLKPVRLKYFPEKIIELMENEDTYINWAMDGCMLVKEQLSFNKVKILINDSLRSAIDSYENDYHVSQRKEVEI